MVVVVRYQPTWLRMENNNVSKPQEMLRILVDTGKVRGVGFERRTLHWKASRSSVMLYWMEDEG